jgi:hypothetical protein
LPKEKKPKLLINIFPAKTKKRLLFGRVSFLPNQFAEQLFRCFSAWHHAKAFFPKKSLKQIFKYK